LSERLHFFLILLSWSTVWGYTWSDINDDGIVDLNDLVAFVFPDANSISLQQPKYIPPYQNAVYEPNLIADLNGDGVVNLDDFSILSSEWLTNDYSEYSRVPAYGKYIPSDVVQTFESTSGFIRYGNGTLMAALSTDFRTGFSGLKLENPSSSISIPGCGIGWDRGPANKVNLQYHNFQIRYYLPSSPPPPLYLILYFYNGPVHATNRGILTLPAHEGWNTVEFGTQAIASYGTFDIAQPVQTINFSYGPISMAPGAYVVWNLFEAWPTGLSKGAVIFTFDDGYEGSYLYGIKYLYQFGYRSVFYVAGEKIETYRFCTWNQIHAAEDAGALIATHGNHTITYPNYDAATDEEIENWCIQQKQFLYNHGFTSSVDYFCIPAGQKRVSGLACVRGPQDFVILRKYFKNIRGTQPYWQDSPDGYLGNVACMPRYPRETWWSHPVSIYTDTSNYRNVDNAIRYRDVVVFEIHNLDPYITDNVTGLVSNFKNLVDYVKAKVDAGLLDVITFEDIVDPNSVVDINKPEYTLTIEIHGNGTVTKHPDKATYYYGDQVVLTPEGDPNWIFDSWSGDTMDGTLTMDGDKAVITTFVPQI
jgi:peptidoglycan/xylan/chitin deacetylase (PgdA/CDA1 family)